MSHTIFLVLYKGGTFSFLVDDSDAELVASAVPWHILISHSGQTYVQRYARNNSGNPTTQTLHRFLLVPPPNIEVDHINGNGLDNRRINVRLVTRPEQMQNQRKQDGRSSAFRGVTWDKDRNKWKAQVKRNRKTYFLGRFDSEISAAQAAANGRGALFTHAVESRHLVPTL